MQYFIIIIARCLETLDVYVYGACLCYVCCVNCVGVCGKVCCVAAVVKDNVFLLAYKNNMAKNVVIIMIRAAPSEDC